MRQIDAGAFALLLRAGLALDAIDEQLFLAQRDGLLTDTVTSGRALESPLGFGRRRRVQRDYHRKKSFIFGKILGGEFTQLIGISKGILRRAYIADPLARLLETVLQLIVGFP